MDISDHPFPEIAHTSSLEGAPAAVTPSFWGTSQCPSPSAFLLLLHPTSFSGLAVPIVISLALASSLHKRLTFPPMPAPSCLELFKILLSQEFRRPLENL